MTTKDLTPSEISNLWNTYLINTMTVWVTRYFLANSQDENIYNMLKNAEMFSVKEVEFKMMLLTEIISVNYGTALSTMMRRDLGLHFMRLRTEVLKYGEDSLNLMIKNEYLDQLPMAKENDQ